MNLHVSSEPKLQKASQTWLLSILCGRDPVPHGLIYDLCKLAGLSRILQMLPIILFPPNHIDSNLEHQSYEDGSKEIKPVVCQVIQSVLPVRLRISSQQSSYHLNPNHKSVRASKEKVVPKLIRFTTEETTLNVTPNPHTIPRRQSISHSKTCYKGEPRHSLREPKHFTPILCRTHRPN